MLRKKEKWIKEGRGERREYGAEYLRTSSHEPLPELLHCSSHGRSVVPVAHETPHLPWPFSSSERL